MANIARQPVVFEVGNDFDQWYTQFSAYCTICGVTAENKYTTLITFLSPRAYSLVNTLALPEGQRANIDAEEPLKSLRNALTSKKSNVPFRIQLQHRMQKHDESLSDYMYELEKLANKAYPGNDNVVLKRTVVIDQFSMGVENKDLSIDLLKHTYTTTHELLQNAQQFESAFEIARMRQAALLQPAQSQFDVFANTSTDTSTNVHSRDVYNSETIDKDVYDNVQNVYNDSKDMYNYNSGSKHRYTDQKNDNNWYGSSSGAYYGGNNYTNGRYGRNQGAYVPGNNVQSANKANYTNRPQNAGYSQYNAHGNDQNARYDQNTTYGQNSNYRRSNFRQKRPVICYACNKPNHYSYQCKTNIECYACHARGHYSYECSSKKAPGSRAKPNNRNF